MSLNHVSAICLAALLLLTGCVLPGDETDDSDLNTAKESDDDVLGCTYDFASNFDPNATLNDGSCSIDDTLDEEYDRGYSDGYGAGLYDGNIDGDSYWNCILAGVHYNALADFSQESFEAAWSEQPDDPDWCGSEFNYESLEIGESVMPALEDEGPEYFDWYGGVVARSDHYYWYDDTSYTETECEDMDGVWNSTYGLCGEYLYYLEVERDANLIYEYDYMDGTVWWGKYEVVGDYMYIGEAATLSNDGYNEGYDYGYELGYNEGSNLGYDYGYEDGYTDGLWYSGPSGTSTLDVILERGSMKCGVKTSQFGMGYWTMTEPVPVLISNTAEP